MKKKKVLALLLAATITAGSNMSGLAVPVSAAADLAVTDTAVDYQKNPVGMDASDVKFSWAMTSAEVGAGQKSYRIVVTKDSTDGEVIWDSGIVEDDRSTAVYYDGDALKNETRYYWTVTVTDKDGDTATSEPAYFETATDMSDAQWIVAGREGESAPLFRTEANLDKEIASARLYITSMGVYDAYINGQRVLSDVNDIFNPGWTNFYTNVNYQTYDVTNFLTQGDNAIGVAVGGGWYQTSYNTDYSDAFGDDDTAKERGLLAKIVVKYADGSEQVITTNADDWKASTHSPYVEDDFFNGETFDANIADEITGWNEAGYDVSDTNVWKAVTTTEYKGTVNPSARAEARIDDSYEQKPISGYTYNESENIEGTGTSEGLCYGEVVEHEVDVNGDIELKAGDKLILDMGQNMVGLTDMILSGEKDTTVTLRFAEALNDGRDADYVSDEEDGNGPMGSDGPKGTLYRIALRSAECTDEYVMTGAEQEEYQQTFTYRGFRYVEVSATSDITVHSVRGRVVTSVGEKIGTLETSNEEVNQLFQNTLWSQMGNYLSIPTDCPQRDERGGWTGDAQLFAQTAMLNFDITSFLENYIDIMNDYAQQNNNVYGPTMPESGFAGWKNCGWSDAGVIIPWVVYQETGDARLIEQGYEQMDLYMSSVNSVPDMTDEASGYNSVMFGDWLAYSGTSLGCMNALYRIYVTQLMEKMANVIGNEEMASKYAASYDELKAAFMEKYVDEEGNLLSSSADNETEVATSLQGYPIIDNAQTGLLWALKTGMYTSDEMKETMVKNLLANVHNEGGAIREGMAEDTLSVGFLGVNVILPVLTDIGAGDLAYTLLLQNEDPSWLYAVENGATTTWERWNSYSVKDGYGNSSMNSFNHYSYGSCIEWIYNYMSGIKSDENAPGYKHIILQPTVDTQGRIDSVNGSYKSMYGLIESNWTSKDGKIATYKAVVPANSSATLYLPVGEETANGLEVPEGATYVGKEERNGVDCARYELEAGTYEFNCEA